MTVKSPFKTIIEYVCKEIVDISEDTVECLKFFEDDEGELMVNFSDGEREYIFVFCNEIVIDMYDIDDDDEVEYFSRRKLPVRIKNAVFRAKKMLKKEII